MDDTRVAELCALKLGVGTILVYLGTNPNTQAPQVEWWAEITWVSLDDQQMRVSYHPHGRDAPVSHTAHNTRSSLLDLAHHPANSWWARPLVDALGWR